MPRPEQRLVVVDMDVERRRLHRPKQQPRAYKADENAEHDRALRVFDDETLAKAG
jgi:hypothetical protein